MAKIDIHAEITDQIITHLEKGALPWRKEWQGGQATFTLPRRANGEFYKGINVLVLWMASEAKGYHADRWMTFKQAKAAGGNVRKGERGTKVVYYDTFKKEDENGEEHRIPFLKSYTVFNVQQIENLPEDLAAQPVENQSVETAAKPIEQLEIFYNDIGARITIDGSQPRYMPAADTIHMPQIKQFSCPHAYYGTLAHELVHWTGHKSRLDRLASMKREAYAFEELIAELGACFTTAHAGGIPDLVNSAAYIGSWLRALKNDKRLIFRAASAAQKASDFLIEASADQDLKQAA